jgi:hypothetical protein
MFPKQGDREPWINTQNYTLDKELVRQDITGDGALLFSNPVQRSDEDDSGHWESDAA